MKFIYESKKLKESYADFDKSYQSKLDKASSNVIASYQNANKHFDEVKEFIYTNLSCPFFSSYVHGIAHSMPGRFDKFGDILHTINMPIPYPTTYQLDKELKTIDDCFKVIFKDLDYIKESLNKFIDVTDKENHGMAVAAENLLNDIESEYPMLYRLNAKWKQSKDLVEFDKYVMQYVDHKGDLLESRRILRNRFRKNLRESEQNAYNYKAHVIIDAGDYYFIKGINMKFETSKEAEDYIDDNLI